MLTTILVPVDGSPLARQALPFAMRLAVAAHGWIILARITRPRHIAPTEEERSSVAELNALAEQARAARIPVDVCIRHAYQADTSQAIAELVAERRADVVVMATHARAGLGRLMQASVAEAVLRRVEVPLMLVPPRAAVAWPTDRPLKILVPLDGSPLAEEALGTAAELATVLRAELVLVRVLEPAMLFPADPARAQAEARESLERAASRLRSTAKQVRLRTASGTVAPTLLEIAQEEAADLVVMSTHGRSGLARLTLGSVATELLEHTPRPLALICPRARQALEADGVRRWRARLRAGLAASTCRPGSWLPRLVCWVASVLLALLALGPSAAADRDANDPGALLVQGPFLGAVTDRSVSLWARTKAPGVLQVEVTAADDPSWPGLPPFVARVAPDRDATAVVSLSGLAPLTSYSYRVSINGLPSSAGRDLSHVATRAAAGALHVRAGWGPARDSPALHDPRPGA